ncbi:hypothetical protein BEN30_17175 [Magnetovibrio blakemorei]|uniref:Uncharacterized protein n=1 Tax=Magnetovibrio blakemorei TaxID=28181 RepID=A0A1E5Q3A0_9PROT|nr:hypothetical protein BEN30_17175 [Magnetovibrio blakemorei]
MVEVRHIKDVIGPKAIRVDNAVRPDFAFKDGQKRFRSGVWDGDGIDPSTALEQTKDRNLAAAPRPRLSFLTPPK